MTPKTRHCFVGLVGCSAMKAKEPAPARTLYTSPLFSMSLQVAEAQCNLVRIVSAHHGLVAPDDVIWPYDRKLSELGGLTNRNAWGHRVMSSLRSTLRDTYGDLDTVQVAIVVYAGAEYARSLRWGCIGWHWHVQEPMAALLIGQRLQWLRGKLDGIRAASETPE